MASENADTVTKLLAKNGSFRNSFEVEQNPVGVLFDGSAIWVANYQSGSVTKITRATQ